MLILWRFTEKTIFRGVHEKAKTKGGLFRKGGLDSFQI